MTEKMDKMSTWVYFILAKLTFPIFVTSNLLLTAVNYFILDLGEDSYFLPSPILYVLLERNNNNQWKIIENVMKMSL